MVVTHPSGIQVEFEAEPKRLYRIYDPAYPERGWVEVPSVTTVLNVLDKSGALTWWGMRVGIRGAVEMSCKGLVNLDDTHPDAIDEQAKLIESLLTAHKLTVNHQRDKAGDRGSRVHDALETWAAMGTVPHPDDFSDEDRGYVQGLSDFLTTANIEPVAHEVMVGSSQHGYAGRFDLRARITAPSTVVGKCYPKKPPRMTTVPEGEGIFDLKTSAGVYETHPLQLEAYEAASVECGYEPTNWRAILHVTADGKYELVKSRAKFEHFLAVKSAHDALLEVKESMKV